MFTFLRYSLFMVLILTAARGVAQTPRGMTLIDVLNMPQVADPELSPDGRQILYVESKADWKANRRIGHIWRVNADGSGLMQMTVGDGENSPRWSPDGKTIAFIARRGAEPEAGSQVFLIPAGGGEARPLTTHVTAVSDIAWSPDKALIYFRATDPKPEEQKAREKSKDDVFMVDEDYQQQCLWNISISTRAEHRITPGNYSVLAYQLSSDGQKIVIHRAPSPLLDDGEESEVWVMDADGGGARQITHNHIQETEAALSPDGSRVLFLAEANQKFETYYSQKLFVAPATGGEGRLVMPDLPYEVDRAAWSRDGKSIFFLANMGVHTELFNVGIENSKPEQLTNGKHTISGWAFSSATNQHVFTLSEMSSPGEVWIMGAGSGSGPRKVTTEFGYLTRDFRLPRQEKVEWKGADGVTIEGVLYYPLDYQEGKRYPLAVQSHGGTGAAQASDKFGFGGERNYAAVLAAKGYAVLQPNYRGSSGYGDAFLRDLVGHIFQNAHLDVLAGVDYLVKIGIADADHMVAMGWSWGGHMTNKLITVTDRFKAASVGAGSGDWMSMYAQSDVRTFRTPWFGGTPWQKGAPIGAYWDHSALKDVWKVTTPTIFLVGQNDQRVPEPQSLEMYRALKSNGVPTHLYVAPREPHGWAELRHVLFKMNVELAWFEKYAMDRPYGWEKAPTN
jgi:dipeptidyl aminopeptidase/acylaminoacyl peptidase